MINMSFSKRHDGNNNRVNFEEVEKIGKRSRR